MYVFVDFLLEKMAIRGKFDVKKLKNALLKLSLRLAFNILFYEALEKI